LRGRLVQNVITARDDAVHSARQLGAEKRVSMWQPDSQVGLVVLSAPPQIMVPKLKHDVPLLPDDQAGEE